jgi:hypothetical protein
VIPRSHPYIQNYLKNRDNLCGLKGASWWKPQGDILMRSTKTRHAKSMTRFSRPVSIVRGSNVVDAFGALDEVTEEGFQGGPRCPMLMTVRQKPPAAVAQHCPIRFGGPFGTDFKSSMIVVPLLDKDPTTGKPSTTARVQGAGRKLRAPYEAAVLMPDQRASLLRRWWVI